MGLPGSGKTYLTERLVPLLNAAWYNADKLREMSNERLSQEGALFSTRDALGYVPKSVTGNTGADYYFAKNPDFGATGMS